VLALIRALTLILHLVPNAIKLAVVVGMGLLLSFIGLQVGLADWSVLFEYQGVLRFSGPVFDLHGLYHCMLGHGLCCCKA
jgi:xanthine/uracil/vitamin C permease (AzgA family)